MERQLLTNDWFSISLLIILTTFLVLKISNKGKYVRLVSFEYIDYYWLYNNKDRQFLSYFEFLVFMLSHLIFAQFLVTVLKDKVAWVSPIELSRMELLFGLFGITIVWSILKFQIEKGVNLTFNRQPVVYFFIYYKQFVWTYAYILALPFLILDVYFPSNSLLFLYGFVGVYLIFSGYNLYLFGYKNRGFILRHWYYFILYICTLELAPYFLIYKLFTINNFY